MTRRGRTLLLALLLGSLLAGAPISAGPQGQVDTGATATDAMKRMADEVAREVEALRGWKFKQPVAKVLTTPADVRRYIERQIDEQLPGGKVARVQAFLRTIGLIPESSDLRRTFLELLENQVGGYYDSETKTLHLVRREQAMPAILERTMLAHELTHALDDQYADLGALVKSRSDRTEDDDIVMSSVVEGSATALMMQYMTRAMLAGKLDMTEMQKYGEQELERSKPLFEAPRYFMAMVGSYVCGMQFLLRGNLMALAVAPDNQAVGNDFLAARKDPPRSSEQILHPEKYWAEATRDEPVRPDDATLRRLLETTGRAVVHVDTVGEMLTAILTSPASQRPDPNAMQLSGAWTNAAATGWGGDRFYLLASGSSAEEAARDLKNLKGVWLTLWDSPADRDEFVTAAPGGSLRAGHTIAPLGNLGAIVLFGFDTEEGRALAARLDKEAVPMTRAGKPWSPRTH